MTDIVNGQKKKRIISDVIKHITHGKRPIGISMLAAPPASSTGGISLVGSN
jgi:hypothetical protein